MTQDPRRYRMYRDLAHLWPVISPPEGYALEARYWKRALRSVLGEGRHRLLELGVGGGHNLSHLTDEFDAVAVDLSPDMLENSRRLNPGVEHHVGDMRDVRLEQRVDAVVIHDAVAYLRSEDDLARTFATAAHHLRPGGAFVTVPDHTSETFTDPLTRTKVCPREGDRELTFFEYVYDPDPTDTTYQTLYVYVLREGGGVPEVITDTHVHGLFPRATWERLLAAAGFSVEVLDYAVEGGAEGFMFVGRLEGAVR